MEWLSIARIIAIVVMIVIITLVVALFALVFLDQIEKNLAFLILFALIVALFVAVVFFAILEYINNKRKLKELDKEIQDLSKRILIVTSSSVPSKEIKEVKGTVVGISKTAASYDLEFKLAEKEALLDIMKKALELGANCIIDLKMTTGSYGGEKSVVSKVIYTGTAVRI